MLDLQKQEPHLNINPAILSYHGPNTAILYAYLKYYVQEKNIQLTDHENYPYYEFSVKRSTITKITGLSDGQQIDAELDLCGAFLADTKFDGFDIVRYTFYPQHEDSVRRWIYEKQGKWIIKNNNF